MATSGEAREDVCKRHSWPRPPGDHAHPGSSRDGAGGLSITTTVSRCCLQAASGASPSIRPCCTCVTLLVCYPALPFDPNRKCLRAPGRFSNELYISNPHTIYLTIDLSHRLVCLQGLVPSRSKQGRMQARPALPRDTTFAPCSYMKQSGVVLRYRHNAHQAVVAPRGRGHPPTATSEAAAAVQSSAAPSASSYVSQAARNALFQPAQEQVGVCKRGNTPTYKRRRLPDGFYPATHCFNHFCQHSAQHLTVAVPLSFCMPARHMA